MKKLLTVLVVVLFIFTFVGCSGQADIPATPEEASPTVDLTLPPETPSIPVEEEENEPESLETSVEISDEESSAVLEQLAGVWHNDADHTVEIDATGKVISAGNGAAVQTMATLVPCYEENPASEFPAWEWTIHRAPNGAYVIRCCQTHLEIWFFPVGVEMVRYNTNRSTMTSDTSRKRVFLGTFSLTTCCPDEEILHEVFYRAAE